MGWGGRRTPRTEGAADMPAASLLVVSRQSTRANLSYILMVALP
jgi:hypothetical protein